MSCFETQATAMPPRSPTYLDSPYLCCAACRNSSDTDVMLTGRSAVDARPTVRQRNGGAGPINVCRVGLHVPAPSACVGSPSRLASFSLRQGGLVMKNE